MPNPLDSFTAVIAPYGGEVSLKWKLPDTLPDNYSILIFKRALTQVTDQEITDYQSGSLTNDALQQKGIYVFRDIPNSLSRIQDFAVENNKLYTYRAVVKDNDDNEYSTTTNASATPKAEIAINSVDTKGIVCRAMEKTVDAMRTANGQDKLAIIGKSVQVFRDHSQRQEQDFFIVVSRGPGQSAERYLDNFIAENMDSIVRGEVDVDSFQVEWICIGKPTRRDKFSDLFRVTRALFQRYVIQMGSGDIREVRVIMNGDGSGKYPNEQGADACRGSATVAITVESQLEVGRNNVGSSVSWITEYLVQ